MVDKNNHNTQDGGPPPIDDAWWMAILEDVEGRFTLKSHPKTDAGSQIEPTNQSKAITPDWDKAKELYQRDQVIEMEVTGHNRGGILVASDSLLGFVPMSHLLQVSRKCDEKKGLQKTLEAYHGRTLRLKVIECDPERGRVVLSERAAKTDPGRRIQLLDDLNEGDCVHGYITTITNFGAFVDLGGIEGLIHISELSWGRVRRPNDVVSEGQQVEVCVIQIDRKRSRVALSLKRLLPNPWENVETQYSPGQIIDAVVTSVVSFGAFARLDSGLDGLIHASELGDNGNDDAKPDEILSEGQRVRVRILQIDSNRQRLGLSLQSIYD